MTQFHILNYTKSQQSMHKFVSQMTMIKNSCKNCRQYLTNYYKKVFYITNWLIRKTLTVALLENWWRPPGRPSSYVDEDYPAWPEIQ